MNKIGVGLFYCRTRLYPLNGGHISIVLLNLFFSEKLVQEYIVAEKRLNQRIFYSDLYVQFHVKTRCLTIKCQMARIFLTRFSYYYVLYTQRNLSFHFKRSAEMKKYNKEHIIKYYYIPFQFKMNHSMIRILFLFLINFFKFLIGSINEPGCCCNAANSLMGRIDFQSINYHTNSFVA